MTFKTSLRRLRVNTASNKISKILKSAAYKEKKRFLRWFKIQFLDKQQYNNMDQMEIISSTSWSKLEFFFSGGRANILVREVI